jgi:hypothetical protein
MAKVAFRILLHCERADIRDALHAEFKALRKTLKLRQRKKITDYDDALDRNHLVFGRCFLSAPNFDCPRSGAKHATAIF